MRLVVLAIAFLGCEDPDPFADPAFMRAHQGLIGPGGTVLESDPCPEAPGGQYGCEALVSARRISWFGYVAKWMQIYRVFGLPLGSPGSYAALPADQLELAYGHPDRLGVLTESGNASQFASFHEVLGEPLDRYGVEATTIAAFRGQHSLHLTAGAVKQACRISTHLARQLEQRLNSGTQPTALADLVVERSGTRITRFKPEFGLLTFGRRLDQTELAAVDDAMSQGATFTTALAALMCSTSALVE